VSEPRSSPRRAMVVKRQVDDTLEVENYDDDDLADEMEMCDLCHEGVIPGMADAYVECCNCGVLGCGRCVNIYDDVLGELCFLCWPTPRQRGRMVPA
jgi:hypothetical protein